MIGEEEGKEKNRAEKKGKKKKRERAERRGEETYKAKHICTGDPNPYLYWILCSGSIPGTNEGYEPVQKAVFPVVHMSWTK
jgi:hypothetical protein